LAYAADSIDAAYAGGFEAHWVVFRSFYWFPALYSNIGKLSAIDY